MDMLFNQIIVFILTAIYFPLIIGEIVAIVIDKDLTNRIGYGIVLTILITTFPRVIRNYQQYLMGHFSGLPEVITNGQTISNILTVAVILLMVCLIIKITIKFKKMKG